MFYMTSMLDTPKSGFLMFNDCSSPASRRYTVQILSSMAVYTIFVTLSVRWLRHNPAAPWKYLIAVAPMLPALVVPVAVVRFLREIDELQRRIQLEALAVAFTATAVITLTYGFLQNAGLPDLSWIWVWPIMGISWVIGLAVARWRYR